jgi:phosphoglucomutase
MRTNSLAGKPAPKDLLINVNQLEAAFYQSKPDPNNSNQLVSFGTSGHRGTSANGTFTEAHILAITQAICEYRRGQGIDGPLFMGKDTHALSRPAERVALEVLAANGIDTFIQQDDGFTPTPVISRAILTYNRGKASGLSDGIVITPSHNPPGDGGFKYNATNGGPADTDVTGWIQNRANELLRSGNRQVHRLNFDSAVKASTTHVEDFVRPYLQDLSHVVDLEAIRSAGVQIGVDPLGGAAAAYWRPLAELYRTFGARRERRASDPRRA